MFIQGGCGNDYRIDPLISDEIYGQEHYDADRFPAIDLTRFYFPETPTSSRTDRTQTAYAQAVTCQTARNRLQAILLQRSDRLFEVHKGKIIAVSNNVNGSLDLASTVTSGIAPLFPVKSTVDALAVSASLLNQASVIFNNRAYAGLLLPKILGAMIAGREELLVAMTTRSEEDTTAYTVDDMVRLVNMYHQRGSILYGIQKLAGTEGETQPGTATSSTPP